MVEEKVIKRSSKFRRELNAMRSDADVVCREDCTNEENRKFREMRKQKKDLPENVYEYYKTGEFFRIYELDTSDEERIEYLLLKQREELEKIRSGQTWLLMGVFTPLVIGLVIWLISITG